MPQAQTRVNDTSVTVRRWLTDAIARLISSGFEEAKLDAELLLCHVLKASRTTVATHPSRALTPDEREQLECFLRRRLEHEPLQYIVGWTEFMGIRFSVDRRVLIPRPETELLVEEVLRLLKSSPWRIHEVLDVGTGSGNIPIAIQHFSGNAHIVSIDVSADAIEVARTNLERLGIAGVDFVQADVFSFLPTTTQFDLIVANPPYIRLNEVSNLQPEVRDYEPALATTDGGDGLRFLRHIISAARHSLQPGGTVLVELGFGQEAEARRIAVEGGLSNVVVLPDYNAIPRVLRAVST